MVGQCQNFYSRENIIFLTFTETFQIETHFEISYLGVLQFGHIKKFQNVFVFFLVFAVRNGNPWLQKSGNGAGQSEQILKFIDFQLFPVFPTAYLHQPTTISRTTFQCVSVGIFPVAESLLPKMVQNQIKSVINFHRSATFLWVGGLRSFVTISM